MMSSAPASFHHLPLKVPDADLFLFESASVLFSARTQSLYALDGPATAALLALDGGGEIQAEPELRQLFEELQDNPASYQTERERLPVVNEGPRLTGKSYSLLGTEFLLHGDPEVIRPFLPLLEHLEVAAPGTVDVVIDIAPHGDQWQLLFNGVALDRPVSRDRIFPYLQGWLRVFAYQGIDSLLTLHGAVLTRQGSGLLLPGVSGAGKSTLALTLLTQGYRLLSDEVAVIAAADRQALPVPMGAAVKSGSRPVLEPLYPELRTAAEFTRWDGQRVRYLPPAGDRFATAPAPIGKIVFPEYAPGAELEFQRLDPVEALRRLTTAGYQLKGGLTVEKTEILLQWLVSIPAFSLRYGSSEQALEGLESCST